MGGAPWLWARADLRHRWTSSILLVLLVAVPVGATLALIAGARRADESVDRFASSTDLADIVVFLDGSSTPPPELETDARIARIDRTATVAAAPASMEINELAFTLVGTDAASPGGLGRPMLLAGRYPAPGSADEIMVNERAAEAYGFEVGTRAAMHALVGIESLELVELGDAEVVGITRLPFDLVDDPATQTLVVAGPEFASAGLPDGAMLGSNLWLHLHDPDDAADVVADLSPLIANGDVEVTSALLAGGQRAAGLQRNGLLIAAAIVAAAGLLAISQAAGRHLAQRREDSNGLAAIGLTSGGRMWAGLLALAPGLAAGVFAGLAVAVLASTVLPLGLARRADPVHGLRADWQVLGIGFAAVLVVVCAVAAVVVRHWVRHDSSGDGSTRTTTIARVAAALGLRPVPSVGSHLALSSGRGRARLPVLPTLAALAGTIAVVAGSLAVRSSLVELAGDAELYGQPWDVLVDADPSERGVVGRQLMADPRVAGIEAGHTGEIDVAGADGTIRQISAIGLEGMTGPMWLAVLDGRAPAEPGEIAIGTATMRALDLSVGDLTTVSGPCGERRVAVVGRAVVPLLSTGDDPDSGLVLPLTTFDEVCANRLIAELDEQFGVLLRLHDDRDAAAVAEELRDERWAVAIGRVPSSVAVLADVRQVPLVLAAVIGLLWLLVGTHAMLLAVRRRGGDLAVLRALGMRPAEVRRAVSWQAVAIGVVTLGIGIPAGLILGRVVWTAIADPANVLVRLDVDPLAFAVMALAAMALLVGAALWPGQRAARLRPIDVLRSE